MKKTSITIGRLISSLNRLIRTTFKNDPTDPGLTLSSSKPGRVYAAVVRFNKPFGKDGWTALKARNKNMRGALRDLLRQIRETQ
jgi:hypothetical protein